MRLFLAALQRFKGGQNPIDRMQKWPPTNYSFVFVLISLTSLVLQPKFFEFYALVLTHHAKTITLHSSFSYASCVSCSISSPESTFLLVSTKNTNSGHFQGRKSANHGLQARLPTLRNLKQQRLSTVTKMDLHYDCA